MRFQAGASPGPILMKAAAIDRMTGQGHLHGMRRWAEVLTTLVLFAIVMTAIGWAANASAPSVHAWAIDHVGQAGFWGFFVVLWITGGVLLYREKAGRAAGR
ncbi:hypothetical protein MKL09_04435 [Methylobacterium sp. J-048]|uniref:hypothetical protein n=1 Tax=Methylobacterium sp. J-048 TaxID=2836635 RepID=UPI001FBB6B0F|nr:hypothetical protein [Methylobacterium sp. J-048]MCJ2055794.1 hypothetical protein [Methylobacterium sp. J-048]